MRHFGRGGRLFALLIGLVGLPITAVLIADDDPPRHDAVKNEKKTDPKPQQDVKKDPLESDAGKDGGKWISMHDEAQRLIGEAPGEALDQYRAQYNGLARQRLADANHSGDPVEVGRVACSYFHTDAGYEAANRLGSLHLDR